MIKLTTFLLLLCLAVAESAFAGPILFWYTNRAVGASVAGAHAQSSSTGPFNQAVGGVNASGFASASQNTVIDAAFFGGDGTAAGATTAHAGEAWSSLAVGFDLDESYFANLSVGLSGIGQGYGYTILARYDPYPTHVFDSTAINSAALAEFNAILEPGRYAFFLGANVYERDEWTPQFSGTGTFDGSLSLTPLDAAPVPEPASMTMLGLGLAAAGAQRWRARRQRNVGQ
jgi:hypothetical protein